MDTVGRKREAGGIRHWRSELHIYPDRDVRLRIWICSSRNTSTRGLSLENAEAWK